jgi:hypothetical protein
LAQTTARLKRAFHLALCREPTKTELTALQSYYDRQAKDFATDPDRAKNLLPAALASEDKNHAEFAALVLACRAILNTDAFITRE